MFLSTVMTHTLCIFATFLLVLHPLPLVVLLLLCLTGVQSLLSLLNFNFAFEAQRAQQFDPLTCSAEQYLAHIIFPTLNESLTVLDRIRPEDPVEFLAVYLQQKATEEKQHKLELEEIHNLREKLRNTIKQEYNVQGRA